MTEGQKMNTNYFNLLQLKGLRGQKVLDGLCCDELDCKAKELMSNGYTVDKALESQIFAPWALIFNSNIAASFDCGNPYSSKLIRGMGIFTSRENIS